MRAVVHDRYGPPEVLRLDEVEPPVPKDDELLVRVRASTVTQTDSTGAEPGLSYMWCGRGLMCSNASQSSRGGENTSTMTAP